MLYIALKMLLGDPTKFVGLVFGVAFSTLLITQQAGIFAGVIARTSSLITDAQEANIWVMDPAVAYVDSARPLRDIDLFRVKSVSGVAWAVPFYKAVAPLRTLNGTVESTLLLGVDDYSLIGVPQRFILGRLDNLRIPNGVAIDRAGYLKVFPGQPLRLQGELELNDHRATIVAIIEASAPFATTPVIYTRYSQAMLYLPQGRNQISYILARAQPDKSPDEIAHDISAQTGLKALSSEAFASLTQGYYMINTAIPVNFGVVILLGVLVGVAVVGLTFHMFVFENIQHYATLKAIGITDRLLLVMVLVQASVVGGAGYGIGIGAAAAFFKFAATSIIEFRGLYLSWWIPLLSLATILVIVAASILVSLRRVMRADPAAVFRNGA
jgi:putative ABC transport system permease protein